MSGSPIVDRIRIIPRLDDFLDRTVGSSGEVFFDKQSNTLRLYSGKLAGGYSVLTDKNISEHIISSGVGVVEYTVTVGVDPDGLEAGNKYFIDGIYKPTLSPVTGFTYVFITVTSEEFIRCPHSNFKMTFSFFSLN